MATNLAIDDELLKEAQLTGKHKTKKAAVTVALEEYIRQRKQVEIIDMFGQIDYDSDYNYKDGRKRR